MKANSCRCSAATLTGAGFAENMHEGGLRKMPGGGSFGRAAVAIEASHQKKTRRQLKIECKEIGAQQIEREDDKTISF